MANQPIDVPQAFLKFGQGFHQDATHFRSMDDLIRNCLCFIPRSKLEDFVTFSKRVQANEFTDTQLEALWRRTDSDYFLSGKAVRFMLIRGREIAESEGRDGSLYDENRAQMTYEPMLDFYEEAVKLEMCERASKK